MKPFLMSTTWRPIRSTTFVGALLASVIAAGCDRRGSVQSRLPTFPTEPSVYTPRPPSPRPPLSGPTGSYTVTLTASPACANVIDSVTGASRPLPDSVRVRRYVGDFADGEGILVSTDGSGSRAWVGGIDRYWRPGQPLMTMTDSELTIIVPPERPGHANGVPTCAGGDYWWEDLINTPEREEVFEHCGTWHAPLDGTARIEGTINGAFAYYEGKRPRFATVLFCTAPDHRFTMVRQ
jgi:hypothetical protein